LLAHFCVLSGYRHARGLNISPLYRLSLNNVFAAARRFSRRARGTGCRTGVPRNWRHRGARGFVPRVYAPDNRAAIDCVLWRIINPAGLSGVNNRKNNSNSP
jgi:hypothetical protein